MPLPSKQKLIYTYLLEMFQRDIPQNGRLPSENELATRIGVARRTLRYTLKRLEEEGMIVRTNHGTFLRSRVKKKEIQPITVLVPCPDYLAATGYWSSFLIHQMILGAMESAVKAGTYVVTLPITINNNPNELDLRQFNHLDKDSMIMTHGVEWAPQLLQTLNERGCRCGLVSSRPIPLDKFSKYGTPLCNYHLSDYWECLGDGARQLAQDGARRIIYFGRASTDISKHGKAYFKKAVTELGQEFTEDSFVLFENGIPPQKLLSMLGKLYQKTGFDGLIFDNDAFSEIPADLDFLKETGIPQKTKMLMSVSELLKCSGLPPHTRVLHRPQKKIAGELAEFLLSDDAGQYSHRLLYEFPFLKEFLQRTGFEG